MGAFGGAPRNIPGGFPPNSPDLNPIEKVFARWDDLISKERPSTIRELIDVARRTWKRIKIQEIQRNILSLKKTMKWVVNNNGDIFHGV